MIQSTSLMAYFNDVLPQIGERQKEVLDVILRNEGITNNEICQQLNIPINCITPRTNELVKMNLVKEGIHRNCKITGRKSIAWIRNKEYGLQKSHLREEVVQSIYQRRIQPKMI